MSVEESHEGLGGIGPKIIAGIILARGAYEFASSYMRSLLEAFEGQHVTGNLTEVVLPVVIGAAAIKLVGIAREFVQDRNNQ